LIGIAGTGEQSTGLIGVAAALPQVCHISGVSRTGPPATVDSNPHGARRD